MSRSLVVLALVGASLAAYPSPAVAQQNGPSPEKNSYLSTPELIRTGLSFLKDKNLAINAHLDFRPNFDTVFAPVFAPRTSLIELNIGRSRSREQEAINQQLARETHDLLRNLLEVEKSQLDVQLEHTRIAAEQAKVLGQIRDQAVVAFKYQQQRDEALLRRLNYTFRPGKLVVVVADFSSGGTGEGVEIADEIANALHELRSKCGIDVEILVGEIKPGLVIRNEQMAFDVGRHFPKGTAYAVVWGTLSPRTVGKFRPHVTCAIKVDDDRGLSRNYTIDPESQPLPLGDTPEAQRRDQHRQLVAFSCAVIPGCYASHEITQDRRPDMDKFLKFLETGSEETRKIAAEYRKELEPLTRWIDVRSHPAPGRPKYEYLRRMTPVSKEGEFPRLVLNTKDGSMMTLITEPGSQRAKRFRDRDGEYIAYIDVTETTNRQLLAFLNEVGNQNGGGARWVEFAAGTHLREKGDRKGFELGDVKEDAERPAVNVSYFGAAAYCRWASKTLPRAEEWRAAAGPGGAGKYPWGEELGDLKTRCANALSKREPYPTHRVGAFPPDTSRVGCLDMVGNVSEWCEEFAAGSESDRVVCGGNILDSDPKHFEVTRRTQVPQVTHHAWLGFRGVVRIRVPAEKP
jgi:hypothetical protein